MKLSIRMNGTTVPTSMIKIEKVKNKYILEPLEIKEEIKDEPEYLDK